MEENPFPHLRISNYDFLDETDDRRVCPMCGKSRKYFCYTCYKPVIGTENLTPVVKLPISIDILQHPNECAGKSTASHAAVLAPDNVKIYTYPCVPNYDANKVVLVFPCPQAVSLEELSASGCNSTAQQIHAEPKTSITDLEDSLTNSTKRKSDSPNSSTICRKYTKLSVAPFEKVIFIDSTWNQTNRISKDDRLKGFRCIEMKSRQTKFWRHQREKPSTYLSTIEAIYYFLLDYHANFVCSKYNGEYDNLLFFFCFMYQKIRGMYNGGHHLLAYQQNEKEESNEEC